MRESDFHNYRSGFSVFLHIWAQHIHRPGVSFMAEKPSPILCVIFLQDSVIASSDVPPGFVSARCIASPTCSVRMSSIASFIPTNPATTATIPAIAIPAGNPNTTLNIFHIKATALFFYKSFTLIFTKLFIRVFYNRILIFSSIISFILHSPNVYFLFRYCFMLCEWSPLFFLINRNKLRNRSDAVIIVHNSEFCLNSFNRFQGMRLCIIGPDHHTIRCLFPGRYIDRI